MLSDAVFVEEMVHDTPGCSEIPACSEISRLVHNQFTSKSGGNARINGKRGLVAVQSRFDARVAMLWAHNEKQAGR